MGGFIDVAGMAKSKLQRVEPHRFGSTLGHYGVGYGPYMQLPFYGSFTLREDGGDMAVCLVSRPGALVVTYVRQENGLSKG